MVGTKILCQEDIQLIDSKSLEILEDTGIVVKSQRILDRMAELGCEVDPEKGNIKIPAHLVQRAIETAPKTIKLGGLDQEKSIVIGGDTSYLSTDGQGCYVVDRETGMRRDSTLKDLADSVVLCDALDYIDICWPLVCALDVPDQARTLREIATMQRYTGKHVQSDVFTPRQVPFFMRALETILGDSDLVRERKIFSVVCCSISPLKYDPDMMEAYIDLSEYSVPINVLPMPIAGASSPASLLGTVLMNNIEVLGALTIFQSFSPGTPVIYGCSSSIMDMRTALFAVGAPEEGLLNAACVEMARYYQLPSFTQGLASDAKEPGIQAVLEKCASGIMPWLAGTNVLVGVGLLETCQCLHYEQLIIDEEIFGFIKRLGEGIRGGQEYLFSELIRQVGSEGHFLAEESTVKLIRAGEHYMPKLVNRESYQVWKESPRKDLTAAAQSRVKEILRQPRREYLEPAVIRELDKVIHSAEKALG